MTKSVRIENADTSEYKVDVLVYDMKVPGVIDPVNDRLVETQNLPYPTAMSTNYIHRGRYLIIKESGSV